MDLQEANSLLAPIREQLTTIQHTMNQIQVKPSQSNIQISALLTVIQQQAQAIANLTSLLGQSSPYPESVPFVDYDPSDAAEIERSGVEVIMSPLDLSDDDINNLEDLGVTLG